MNIHELEILTEKGFFKFQTRTCLLKNMDGSKLSKMNSHADRNRQEGKKRASAERDEAQEGNALKTNSPFVDLRPEAIVQRKRQEIANTSQRVSQLNSLQQIANTSDRAKKGAQLKAIVNSSSGLYHQSVNTGTDSHVIQRAFTINGVNKVGGALDSWIEDYTTGRPEIEAVVRGWAADDEHTEDYSDDIKAYEAAESAAEESYKASNTIVGESIGTNNPPNTVAWDAHPVWAAWYFNGLEYQDNKTGGWHSNRLGLLPGGPTDDGAPTRYVEFRRPGAVGTKEVDKMERCIFDLLSGRCWPNAHYDGGYVEITGIPNSVKKNLLNTAYVATGLKARANEMTADETAEAGNGFAKIQWLINHLE